MRVTSRDRGRAAKAAAKRAKQRAINKLHGGRKK